MIMTGLLSYIHLIDRVPLLLITICCFFSFLTIGDAGMLLAVLQEAFTLYDCDKIII